MNYEISRGTLAIVPSEGDSSMIYEDETQYIVPEKPFKIMEDSCKYFGSTYEGRKNGARNILGAEYKVPIVVEDENNLIVFPTTSPLAEDCVWISLKRVKNIEYLAKKTAREVAKTKVEATMDSMNSYERRIVHEVLSKDKYVYTESIGEEPNRKVVIKLKEEK